MRSRTACWIESWWQSVIVIYGAVVEMLAQAAACGMGNREMPSTKATIPQRLARNMHYQSLEEIISVHAGMCCLLLPRKKKEHAGSI